MGPGAPEFFLRFDDEKQENCDEQGENAQPFGQGDADKDAPELAVGSSRIAQGAEEELTENDSDADRCRPRSDRGEACAN